MTTIYGVTRGSFDGIGGISYIGQGWPAGPDFVDSFAAWSGVAYSLLTGGTGIDPTAFPWSTYNFVMDIPDSVYWSGTSTFTTSDIGFLIYANRLNVQLEDAYTNAVWAGTPPPTCVQGNPPPCRYAVVNNCTSDTTPPDLKMLAVDSADYRGIATYLSWTNAAGCIRFYAGQAWTCSKSLSFLTSMNSIMPPFRCTHNP